MSIQTKLSDSWEHLRNSRKAILARGGDISLTAGLKDLSDAAFNISDSSLAQAIDDSTAYRKVVPVGASPYATISKIGGMSYKSNNLYSGEAKMDVVKISGKTVLVAPKDGYYSFNCDSSNVVNPDVLWLESTGGDWIEGWFPFENIYLNKGEEVWFRFNEIPDYDENGNPNYPLSGFITDIMINEGAKSLPYEPYFKGLRAAKVTVVKSEGANLFNQLSLNERSAYYSVDSLGVTLIKADGTANVTVTPFAALDAGDYIMYSTLPDVCRFNIYDSNGNQITASAKGIRTFTLTKPTQVRVKILAADGVSYPVFAGNIAVVRGTEAAPFKPFRADAVDTLTIPSEIISIEGYGESNPDNPEEYNYIDLLANALVLVGRVIDEAWTRFATPEVIPIKINKYLATEEGGSIVFDNEYGHAVPSETKYIIKSGV